MIYYSGSKMRIFARSRSCADTMSRTGRTTTSAYLLSSLSLPSFSHPFHLFNLRYNKLCGTLRSYAHRLSLLPPADPFRPRSEAALLAKLYEMGVLGAAAKLSDVENKLTVAAFCRRRLAVVVCVAKMAESVSAVSMELSFFLSLSVCFVFISSFLPVRCSLLGVGMWGRFALALPSTGLDSRPTARDEIEPVLSRHPLLYLIIR
jgi:hypothetical protein